MICENCGKEHDGTYGSGRFCCKECARSYSSKFDNKNELKQTLCKQCGKVIYVNKRAMLTGHLCDDCKNKKYNYCKLINNQCEQQNCIFYKMNFCNGNNNGMSHKVSTYIKYFNFQLKSNANDNLEQFLNIQKMLQNDIDNGKSCNELCLKYTGNYKKGNMLFYNFNISTRTLSEAIKNAVLVGKLEPPVTTKFHTEFHTLWDNNVFYLRSSYETAYANYLDEYHIKYSVEKIRIKYYDTQRNSYRIAIPDFYLEDYNTIVEIKSTYTLNIQNMKDKANAYIQNNYKFKLILEGKETDIFVL